jgi:hypothetical protein
MRGHESWVNLDLKEVADCFWVELGVAAEEELAYSLYYLFYLVALQNIIGNVY